MDTLVELPLGQWPILQERLKERWPLNVAGFYALDLIINYPNVRESFQFQVFCPMGNIEYGFVATSSRGSYEECIIFATTKDTSHLENALIKTNIIDWSKKICIHLVTSGTLEIMEKIIPKIGFETLCDINRAKTFFLDRKMKPYDLKNFPANVYVAPLKSDRDQIQRVDSTWPYKYPGSHSYFTTLARNDLGYGLYLKDTNALIAWVFLNEYRFLCHLYCEEEYRRQGYSEMLMKHVINDELGRGKDLYSYVENYNEKSSRLFVKLGFTFIDEGAYIFLQK